MSPVDKLLQRRHVVAQGIDALVRLSMPLAARELEGVLCDLDTQILGIQFKEAHGDESSSGPVE